MISGVIFKYVSGGLLIACLILGLALSIEKRGHRKANERIVEMVQLREADRRNYEAAAREAELKAQENVQRVEGEQQRITSDVKSDYARQLADLRARFLRASKANPGVPKDPAVPKAGSSPNGADDPSGERFSPAERQLAAEISLRLRALQDWVRRQAGVNPTPD